MNIYESTWFWKHAVQEATLMKTMNFRIPSSAVGLSICLANLELSIYLSLSNRVSRFVSHLALSSSHEHWLINCLWVLNADFQPEALIALSWVRWTFSTHIVQVGIAGNLWGINIIKWPKIWTKSSLQTLWSNENLEGIKK